jgi:hypothetical protein
LRFSPSATLELPYANLSVNLYNTFPTNQPPTLLQGAVLMASPCSPSDTEGNGDTAPLVRKRVTKEGMLI